MSELNGSDLNVERIMYDIREAVARQHNGTPNASSGEPAVFSPNPTPQNGDSLRLQPPFQPKREKHYHVTDLLRFHGIDFVRNAYLALLLREPDEAGMAHYMDALASGYFNKIDILESLRASPEGRRNNVRVDGLALPVVVRRVGRIPIIGYVVRLMIAVVRLPRLIQHQNQVEFYLWPQLQRIADYENQSRREAAEAVAQVSSQVLDLSQQHEALTQQHQALTQQHQALSQHHEALTTRQVEFGNAVDARFAEFENELESLKADWDPKLDDLYASFEDRFRGEREEVQRRLEVYVPLLIDAGITSGVLDIGSGRGEWLRLLRSKNIAGRGVDRNRVFIEECRGSGLDVAEADALDHLQGLPANSLNVVTSFHLVEHLAFEVLIKMLDEIERVLKPGGLVILETPNPENFMVGSFSFYADPTHRNPIPSETLEFLLASRGFTDTKVWKLRPWEEAKLEGDTELIRRFNEFFYSAPDYAVIAKKP